MQKSKCPTKKKYHSPTLRFYGDLTKLTKGGNRNNSENLGTKTKANGSV